jgi:hypothetical protein
MQDPTVQGFLTGGQQSASEQAVSSPGFGATDSTAQTKLGVFAPLDVKAAPAQAEALANALNVGWSLAKPQLLKDTERTGKEDAAAGEVAAATSSVDPVKAATIEGYRIGAARGTTEKNTLQSLMGATDLINKDANDGGWANLPAPQLLDKIDEYFRGKLGGLETSPESAQVIAPMIQHFMNEAAGNRIARDVRNTQSQAQDTVSALAMHAAQANDGSFDPQVQMDKMAQTFLGDRSAANQAYVAAVTQAAVAAHNPDIIDKFIPKSVTTADGQTIDGPGFVPKNAAAIEAARINATELQKKDNAIATGVNKDVYVKTLVDKVHANVPLDFQKDLIEPVQKGVLTPPEAIEWYQKSVDEHDKHAPDTFAANVLARGLPWYTYDGTQIDAQGHRVTKENFEHAATDAVSALPKEQQPAGAVEMTRRQGLIFKPLESTINNQPLNTQQGVKGILDAYGAMKNTDATITAQYFTNPARREQVEYMDQQRTAGMSDADIATQMKSHDFKQAADDYNLHLGPLVNKQLDNFKIDGSHWLAGDIHSVNLNDLVNGGQVMAQVRNTARVIGEQGLSNDPTTIISRAEKQVLDQNYLIKMNEGHSVLLPRTGNDPPNAQEALQDFYKTQMPDLIKKAGYKGDPADVVLTPNPYQRGVLDLVDHTGHQVSADQFTISGISQSYTKQKRPDLIAQATKDSSENYATVARVKANNDKMLGILQNGSL